MLLRHQEKWPYSNRKPWDKALGLTACDILTISVNYKSTITALIKLWSRMQEITEYATATETMQMEHDVTSRTTVHRYYSIHSL